MTSTRWRPESSSFSIDMTSMTQRRCAAGQYLSLDGPQRLKEFESCTRRRSARQEPTRIALMTSPFRVAVVGLGNAGQTLHLPAFAGMSDVTVVGGCDLDE